MVEPKVQKEDVGEVSGDDIVSETDASKPASKSQVPHDQQKQKTAFDFNEQTNYVPVSRIVILFLSCSTVSLVALLDQTTLAASLAIIGNELDARSHTAWIAGANFLTSTSLQLVYGRLSDIWSRKAVLIAGLIIFFIGSLAASLATSATQLIAFRAFTGIGGGGLMTVAQMIVSDVVPLRERGKYQGILGAVVALSNGIGPVIGGALASNGPGSWRWIFRLNLPLAVFSMICVVFFMPLRKVEGHWKTKFKAIDFSGIFLALNSSTLLMLGLTWAGGDYPWLSSHVLATLIVGFVVGVFFVFWEWKGAKLPLLPPRIFQIRLVSGACITMFINGWNFLVQIYYIPTFYQLVYGYSAVKAGALLLPITVVQTFASTFSGWIVHWTGRYRESILLGWAAWAIGLGLFSTLDESSGLGKQIGFAILTGFGVGQTLQTSLIAVQAGVERKEMAVVTGARNFTRNLGGTLGLAVSGTILNNTLRAYLAANTSLSASAIQQLLNRPEQAASILNFMGTDSFEPGSNLDPNDAAKRLQAAVVSGYRAGFRIVFILSASLAALSFILAFLLMPQVNLSRPDDEKLKKEGRARDMARRGKAEDAEALTIKNQEKE